MAQPRTSPLQKVPSRFARGKYALASRRSAYSIRGADTIPGYVRSMFPKADMPTVKTMGMIIEKYLDSPTGQEYGMPTPNQCKILFEGLID